MSYILEAKNLSYVYSAGTPFEHHALSDVSVGIKKGEFVGLIGHTGSGKSTFVQHLNGLLKPSAGTILLDGQDIYAEGYKLRQVRFRVGLVFQYPEYQLFEETVAKDIAFGPSNMGLSEAEIADRVREAANFVGLRSEHLEKSPFELSGGQKRRVAIAGVIAMRHDVLILDEPTAGLDPHGREQILAQIKNYHETTGATVILVTHSMEDIARTVERLLVMNDSRLVMDGTPEEIFRRGVELEQMGLDVPQITKVFMKLKEMGVEIDDSVYTVKYARNLILKLLGKGEM